MDMLVSQVRPPSELGNPPRQAPALPAATPEARAPPPQASGLGSSPLPLLPPPTLNLIPATPQSSQEKAEQAAVAPGRMHQLHVVF